MKANNIPLNPDGTIDFSRIEFPDIDFSNITFHSIEPSEEDKRRLEEYNKKIA